jgi:FixJ family two-component response regulator
MNARVSRSDETAIVHVVEDDESSRRATARVLRAAGLSVRQYGSVPEFLAKAPAGGPGCIVLDLSLPGPSGLDLQEWLATTEAPLPIVFLTGRGDIPKTARAMKAGAIDFLTKPADAATLVDAVVRALVQDAANRSIRARKQDARQRYARLTPREREVLAHVVSGQLNKQIAYDLGTREHTIKVHRQRVMEKLEADSVPDLVRLADDLGIRPVGSIT